jgi:hypothetical protein
LADYTRCCITVVVDDESWTFAMHQEGDWEIDTGLAVEKWKCSSGAARDLTLQCQPSRENIFGDVEWAASPMEWRSMGMVLRIDGMGSRWSSMIIRIEKRRIKIGPE